MAIRTISFAPNEYYHLYNRGNGKRTIFHDKADRLRFMNLLYGANSDTHFNFYNAKRSGTVFDWDRGEKLVDLGAYVLMPNHFHLLVRMPEGGSVSRFMQKLSTAYCMYYNDKYQRTGSLFEGKFKAEHISNDRYLKYLFSYLHLNPLKLVDPLWRESGKITTQDALSFLDTYLYSSYLEYGGTRRPASVILNTDTFPKYFPDTKTLYKELNTWIEYSAAL